MVESYSQPERVVCIVNDNEIPMELCSGDGARRIYGCSFPAPSSLGLLFYAFSVTSDGYTLYYGNNRHHLGGVGEEYHSFPESRYQITVFEEGFKTPDWMKNAIVYQIFPDRFFRGKHTPFHGIERAWGEEPFYKNEQFGGKFLANDFFGGNFDGIEQKLPYLKDLGVTAIYLNPISKAFSNHRYDTGDYETPDPTLGTVEDFVSLSEKAEKLGIKIILDGVFSHTGADSRYFNRECTYDSVGAFQSKDSPYHSWYTFTEFPYKYDSWWGFDTLPNVNELDESFMSFIAKDNDSVIKKWLRRGASGFRLDVADELPDEFISVLRSSLKEENPDALLIGEVWEDASNKVSYGKSRAFLWGNELDSVMNYVFRDALLGYLTGKDAKYFSMRLHSLFENYPKESLYSAMNLISTHDVPRALTVLADTPDFRTLSREAQHDYVIPHYKAELAKRRMVLAIALQMTLPGAPTVYYGDEREMWGFADPFNRAPMNWNGGEGEILRQTKIFTALRNRTASLRTGFYKLLYADSGVICYLRSLDGGVDAFGKKQNGEDVIVIINAAEENAHICISLDEMGVTSLRDTLSGEPISQSGTLEMDIYPLSYRVFTPERKKS